MSQNGNKAAPDSVRSAVSGALSALAALAGGWLVYSRLFVNHDVHLPLALDAERRIFIAPEAGVLSCYAATAAPGRPLVLIHSVNAAASAYEMRPLFEHFQGQRPVYALDLPGFGFSERANRRYSPELYAQAIIELLASQVGEAADVVALSLGSEFAARAALLRPDLFHSLALISPSGFTRRQDKKASQAVSGTGGSDLAYGLLSAPLWSQAFYDLLVTRPSLRFFLSQSFIGEVPDDLIEYDYLTAHQPGARYAPLYFVSGRLFTPDAADSLYGRLSLPGLVLYDQDYFVRFDLLPHLLETCPNWRAARIIPSQGLPHWEQPRETIRALEDFWRETASA